MPKQEMNLTLFAAWEPPPLKIMTQYIHIPVLMPNPSIASITQVQVTSPARFDERLIS